jgi:hypothetical protein
VTGADRGLYLRNSHCIVVDGRPPLALDRLQGQVMGKTARIQRGRVADDDVIGRASQDLVGPLAADEEAPAAAPGDDVIPRDVWLRGFVARPESSKGVWSQARTRPSQTQGIPHN